MISRQKAGVARRSIWNAARSRVLQAVGRPDGRRLANSQEQDDEPGHEDGSDPGHGAGRLRIGGRDQASDQEGRCHQAAHIQQVLDAAGSAHLARRYPIVHQPLGGSVSHVGGDLQAEVA